MDPDTLKRVAWLARIDADDSELAAYGEHLDRLLDFVADLRSAPTDDVEPMAHPLDAVQRLRADAVTEAGCREEVLAAAPESDEGLFLVPKVIE